MGYGIYTDGEGKEHTVPMHMVNIGTTESPEYALVCSIAGVELTIGQINVNTDEIEGLLAHLTDGNQKTQIVDADKNPVEPVTSIGITPPTTLVAGVKTVTTAGTGERITATSTPCQYVIISALPDNTGTVFVGGSDVDKDTMNGIPLTNPADGDGIKVPSSIIIPIDDLNKLYVDVTASGEGISYTVLT